MITPDVIKKIEDKRREKTRPTDHHVPAHQDVHHPQQQHKETPRKQEDPDKIRGNVIEISVV